MRFDLLTEPWIPVALLDGGEAQVSLREAFESGHDIRRITAALPTQSFAMLRVLLAIVHDALGIHTKADSRRLIADGVDVDAVDAYLDEHHDRFDLFHHTRPFFQVANLRTAKGDVAGLEKLISDVPNGVPFLTMRSGASLERISHAEAAQWLVHAQLFDPSGIRSAAVGDPLTKGGRGYPIGPGWAGRIGGVVLHGRDLLETIAFNAAPAPSNPADRPVWALAEAQTEQRLLEAEPAGPVSVLVWQSRRIRLIGDDAGVTGVVLAQGDQLREQNRQAVETMTPWRYSGPQTKKFGIKVYMPRKHDPARSVWRGMPALLGSDSELREGSVATLPPASLQNLGSHARLAGVDLRAVVEIVGMDYGPQEATVADIVHDTLDIRLGLLGETGAEIRTVVDDCVRTADNCVWALRRFARNIASAQGDFDGVDGVDADAAMRAWSALDAPAREWFVGLRPDTSPTEARSSWQEMVKRELTMVARRISEAAPYSAIRGRETRHGFMTLAKAELFLISALRKELPLAYPTMLEKEDIDA